MKKLFIIQAWFSFLMMNVFVQSTAFAQESLVFKSKKSWRGARWYWIGKWSAKGYVEWLGGDRSSLSGVSTSCFGSKADFTYGGGTGRLDSNGQPEEILRYDQWVAIEVDPEKNQDEIVVSLSSSEQCQGRLTLPVNVGSMKGRGPKPLLMIRPDSNEYFNYSIVIASPQEERADIQLDLLLGYGKVSLPNAEPGASTGITFLPLATARGEWLIPSWNGIGFLAEIEQSVINAGGIEGQNVLFSDWAVGAFYQTIFAWADGLQVRLWGKYHQHLADDGQDVVSLAEPNADARYFQFGASGSLYFGKRWLLGLEGEYGLPNQMSGTGITQAYNEIVLRSGFRLTPALTALLEAGLQNFVVQDYLTEKLTTLKFGVRLDL